MSSSSTSPAASSPCAACKYLRRKCTYDCLFAPYFPGDNQLRFAQVHRVFGASNVTRLLNELSPEQREDAVNTLAYEAEARLRDPVYGCVGYIALLQQRLIELQRDLSAAKRELCAYGGLAAATAGPFGIYNQFYAAATAHQRQVVEAQQLEEVVEMARLLGEVGCVGVSAAAAAAAVEVSPPPGIGGYEDSFGEMERRREEELRLHQRRSFDDGGSGGAGPSC